MSGTIVILVNGEVLANGRGSKISDQQSNAVDLAQGLSPILASNLNVLVLHGNKPQVGYVLFRSELASYALHSVPLDVCGADTQGATGYMLAQAFKNVLDHNQRRRNVMSVVTQTVVDDSLIGEHTPVTAVGPWFDREKADQYRQTRGWTIGEELGRGYRRMVPALPAKEVVEIEGIERLITAGDIVIAGGGGGIPVVRDAQGELKGIEAVVETEQVASMMAQNLKASILLMVVEKDDRYIRADMSTESPNYLSLEQLDQMLENGNLSSATIKRQMKAASEFLRNGGEQVVITTLRGLSAVLTRQNGLRIGSLHPTAALFRIP